MAAGTQQDARLTVISDGPLSGWAFPLRVGTQLLGRDRGADIALESPELSRRHAYLTWDGRVAQVADAGSTNGTVVNGAAVDGARILHSGDVLRLGGLELRLDLPSADTATSEFRNRFDGPVYGTINQAGRDVSYQSWHEHRHEEPDPMQELFVGRGPGRMLMAVGLVVVVVAFVAWIYLIFSSGTDPDAPNMFERELAGLPVALVAFGAFALGGLIAALGGAMSKASRTREAAARRHG